MNTTLMGLLVGGLFVAMLYGVGAWATGDPLLRPFAWAGLVLAGVCGIGLLVGA